MKPTAALLAWAALGAWVPPTGASAQLPGSVFADWAPATDAVRRLPRRLGGSCRQAEACRPLEIDGARQALARIAKKDLRGLGREAGAVQGWLAGKTEATLARGERGWRLSDRAGTTMPLSDGLGRALDRINQYFGMTPETLARPVSHDELAAALSSPAGVESVAAVFEASLAGRVAYGRTVLIPEIGGESTLGAELEFHRMPDPTRALWRELAANRDDPAALAAMYARDPEGMKLIDEHGLLERYLKSLPAWERKGVPSEQRDKVRRLTVEAVLETSGDTYISDPDSQFESILSQDWTGRYAGRWHSHPPNFTRSGWLDGGIPSDNDLAIAVEAGQNLTVAFHPDGFTVYDLSALDASTGPDLSKVRRIEHRSPAWRARFDAWHAKLLAETR